MANIITGTIGAGTYRVRKTQRQPAFDKRKSSRAVVAHGGRVPLDRVGPRKGPSKGYSDPMLTTHDIRYLTGAQKRGMRG